MFNFNKITAEQPLGDPYRYCNRNAMDRFQISGKFFHRLNANQRQWMLSNVYTFVKESY